MEKLENVMFEVGQKYQIKVDRIISARTIETRNGPMNLPAQPIGVVKSAKAKDFGKKEVWMPTHRLLVKNLERIGYKTIEEVVDPDTNVIIDEVFEPKTFEVCRLTKGDNRNSAKYDIKVIKG